MILAVHVVVIGGLLLQGCKDTAKDKASAAAKDEMAGTTSNAGPMTTTPDYAPAPSTTAPAAVAGATPPQPQLSNPTLPPAPVTPAMATPAAVTPAVASVPGVAKEYVIASGDTLGLIAKRNGVSIRAIVDANPGIEPKKLQIGHKLQIPAGKETAGATVAGASGSSGMVAETGALASGDSTSYTVKSGDVLVRIAHAHGTTVKAILALNDMKTTSIRAGQKLKVPVMKVASAETAPVSAPTALPATPASGTATPAPAPAAN
jgi:LysM repeat protein